MSRAGQRGGSRAADCGWRQQESWPVEEAGGAKGRWRGCSLGLAIRQTATRLNQTLTEEEEVVGEEEDETHYKKSCFPPRIGMLGVVVGDHLPRILGDFGAFMVDAHHPPRNAQIMVYDQLAAKLEPSTMIDASFS